MLVAIVVPAVLLIFFSIVPVLPTDGEPVDHLLPGTMAIAVVATAMVSLGIATGFERGYGVLKRLGATPLGRPALLAAKGAGVLAVEAIQVVLLILAAVLLGWTPAFRAAGLGGGVLLGTLAFGGIGMLAAGTLRAEANLAAANGLFLVFLLLSGGLVPLSRLPDPLAGLAGALPAAPLQELLAWGLGGARPAGGAVAVLVAWALLAPLAAALTFSWE